MNIESIREYCLSFPGATEDIKWANNLCFCLFEKIFCIAILDEEFGVSLKVNPEEYELLIERDQVIPAPYLARAKWIYMKDPAALSKKEWFELIKRSYTLIYSKLPKRHQLEIEKMSK